MRRADVVSTHHERPALVTRILQPAENGVSASMVESRHVLNNAPMWSGVSNNPEHVEP